MNIDKTKAGQLISEKRKALGITQNELAEKLYISPKSVSKWETGQNFPSVDMLRNLSNALQIPLTSFFYGENVDDSDGSIFYDWNTLYAKNGRYISYLQIMELKDIDEELILNCIINDYYSIYKKEMDIIYQKQCRIVKAYEKLYKQNNKDSFLAIQNDLQVASTIINRGVVAYDSIDEANFNVQLLESTMTILICLNICDVQNIDYDTQKKYKIIFKYLNILCNMQKCIRIFNTCNKNRGIERVLVEINCSYYEFIEQYFDFDDLILDDESIFPEDYDINEVTGNLRDSICIIENEIYKAIKSKKSFDDTEIIVAINRMGFWAAVLTKMKRK